MSNRDSEGFHTDSWASTSEQRDAGVQPWMSRTEAEWAVTNYREEQINNIYNPPGGNNNLYTPPSTPVYGGGGGGGLSIGGLKVLLGMVAVVILVFSGPALLKWGGETAWDLKHSLGSLTRIMGASWAMPQVPLPPLEAFQGIHPGVKPGMETPKDVWAFLSTHKREPVSVDTLNRHVSDAQFRAEAVAYRCVLEGVACDEKLAGMSKAALDALDREEPPKRAYFKAMDRIRLGRSLATDFLIHASRNGDAPACLALWQWVSRGMMFDGTASYVMQDSGKSAFDMCVSRGKGKALQDPEVAKLQKSLNSFPATLFLRK